MWLATQHGFFSIVQKEEDLFFVRARVRGDLENIVQLLAVDLEIHEWPTADYRYRLMIDLEGLLELIVYLTTTIDYPNFKARIYEREEQNHKLSAYQRIWLTMAELQGGSATN